MAKYCSNCGKELTDEQDICLNCGVKVKKGNTSNGNGNNRSKVAAGILGILLGALGVHNFYLGFTGKGVAQLLISVLSCGILSPVSAIWGLIEGITILTSEDYKDADGNSLSN